MRRYVLASIAAVSMHGLVVLLLRAPAATVQPRLWVPIELEEAPRQLRPTPAPAVLKATAAGATRGSRTLRLASSTVPIAEAPRGDDVDESSRPVFGFYDPWDVDELPYPRTFPNFPRQRESLEVVLTIAGSGRVEGVASPSSLDETEKSALRRMSFLPGTVRGKRVTTTVTLQLRFGGGDGGTPRWERSTGGWSLQQ